jgi:ankyrin repeat protein
MAPTDALKSEAYHPWYRSKGTDVCAMVCAAIAGDLETVKILVAHDPGLADCEIEYFTPLHFAVRENRRDIVDFLLQQKINPESAARASLVAMATMRGYHELAAFLEERKTPFVPYRARRSDH